MRKYRAPMTSLMHGTFLQKLGDRKLRSYSDGGPHDEGRQKRRAKNRAAGQARKHNRRRK